MSEAVHFFHPGGQELLVGIDSNNNPTSQDVWNTLPSWGYPFYTSPQAMSGPASPMISGLGGQAASVGVYALSESPGVCGSLDVPRRHQLLPVDERRDIPYGRWGQLPRRL